MKGQAELPSVDVAVIGAGMAGLSTAVHARLAGLSVRVFEQHFLPGGLCTAWKRKGYTFDYCYEYIVGSGRRHGYFPLWRDLGVMEDREFLHIDSFGRYVGADGLEFNLYTDHRRLQEHMLALAPEDARKIKALCRAIGRLRQFVMSEPAVARDGLSFLIRSLPALPTLLRWSGVFVRQWCAGLRNAFLREAIPALIGWTDFPLVGPLMAFAWMDADCAAYPLGGSLPVARAVEQRAVSLGADIAYRTAVKRVIVEDGRAVGVELEDGRVQHARHVVAACDAHAVFERLLEGRVRDPTYEELFKNRETSISLIQVSLGVRPDPAWGLSRLPDKLLLPLVRPMVVDNRERPRLRVRHYTRDPHMAPPGNTVFIVQMEGDYDRWQTLRADKDSYRAEKARVLAETLRALEGHFPGITERIEASDVATPTTCERYTGNWRGCMQAWAITPALWKRSTSGQGLPKTFPGVDRFHLIGQWTEPASGTPPAVKDGRDVVRAIIKAERRTRNCRSRLLLRPSHAK
ncbi:MAG: NAD(P)/FAD-dependent oxidoreductase [Spirochaetes bacterium]|nr:NAD(P)/FAD-dependent oxidoreductase [Spirochaetota bacterium]